MVGSLSTLQVDEGIRIDNAEQHGGVELLKRKFNCECRIRRKSL